jgi:4-oxalocrotonate tautomerase
MPFIDITLIEGRDPEKLRAMVKRVTDVVEETLAAPRDSIRIVLREVPATHWSVGGEPKG